MPWPSAKAAFGQIAFGDQHAAPHARRRCRAWRRTSPRALPSTTGAPSAMPSAAASSGWIITVGPPPSLRRDVGVSVKVELRKLRAGEVARRNGCARVGLLDRRPSGRAARASSADGPHRAVVAERHLRPVRLEAELAVRLGEAVEVVRGVGSRAGSRSSVRASSSASVPQPEFRSVQSMSSRGAHGEARMLGAEALRQRRRSPRGWMRHSPGGSISFGPSRMCWWPPP